MLFEMLHTPIERFRIWKKSNVINNSARLFRFGVQHIFLGTLNRVPLLFLKETMINNTNFKINQR